MKFEDRLGKELKVGDKVLRATLVGRSAVALLEYQVHSFDLLTQTGVPRKIPRVLLNAFDGRLIGCENTTTTLVVIS